MLSYADVPLRKFSVLFSQLYRLALPCSVIGYWYHIVICLSVMKCIVAKEYILQQKCLKKKTGNAPRTRLYNFQLSTPYTLSPQTPHPKILTLYLFIISRLIMWLFCLCCYKHGRVLLSRWSLINASYAVWSAVTTTAGFFFYSNLWNLQAAVSVKNDN